MRKTKNLKKRVLLILLAVVMTLSMSGCIKGERLNHTYNTKNEILLNTGSCFVYTFCDEETGVWYISTAKGVTPRLKPDGTLFTGN